MAGQSGPGMHPEMTEYDRLLKEARKMVQCPECAAELDLAPDTVVAEIVVCPDCGVELEVLSIDPIAVGLAPEVEEDWGE